jgi:hypothetical protein
MSLASERLVIPITAKDKARVEKKAAMAGKISTAEFVRRAALNYEPPTKPWWPSCAAFLTVSKSCMPAPLPSSIAPMRPSMRPSRISTGRARERSCRRFKSNQKDDPARGANHKPEQEARTIGAKRRRNGQTAGGARRPHGRFYGRRLGVRQRRQASGKIDRGGTQGAAGHTAGAGKLKGALRACVATRAKCTRAPYRGSRRETARDDALDQRQQARR